MARKSAYALGDDAVDGGYHVEWTSDKQVGLRLADKRYGGRSPTEVLGTMCSWMCVYARIVRLDGDIAVFEPIDY
jgi:hypothetical protein